MNQTAEITALHNKIDQLNQRAWDIRVYDSPHSFKLSEEAIELSKRINYKKGLAQATQSLGFCYIRLANNTEALPLVKESLSLFEELNDPIGQSSGYEYLALIQRNWGDLGGAVKLLFKALELAESEVARENISTIYYQLGVTYKYLGNFEKALEFLDKSLAIHKELQIPLFESYPINIIGSIYFETGDYPRALEYYKKALKLRQEATDQWGEAGSLDNVGFTYLKLKEYNQAIVHCTRSLEISKSTDDKRSQGNALLHLAEIYKEAGDPVKAISYCNESLQLRKSSGDKRGEAEILLFLAELHGTDLQEHSDKIEEWLSTALVVAEEMKAKDLVSKCRFQLYEFYRKKEQPDQAMNYLVSHLELEKQLHKNAVDQKMTNLEVSRNAEEARKEIEQVQQRNKELRRLNNEIASQKLELEIKNRELEIETSLERVRTVAMAMQKRDDMVEVCKVMCEQLELLGLENLRNVQTAVFYEVKGSYLNYEYYRLEQETRISENDYNNNGVVKSFAASMMGGPGQFFHEHFTGEKLEAWYAYQRISGHFVDKNLEKSGSLSYYWFSLGPVALGLSAYQELNERELDLFKRFKNVFDLSYRRYLDIEKAEQRVKEANIEAALERVRANSMAMHKSSDLHQVINTVCEQLINLGFQFDAANFVTDQTDQGYKMWLASPGENFPLQIFVPTLKEHLFGQIYEELAKGKDFITYVLTKEEKNIWFRNFFDNTILKDHPNEPKERIYERKGMAASMAVVKNIRFNVANFEGIPYTEEENAIIKRFAAVFEQSYTRFLDLQTAEAQAKEALIEASLERVRSRAMAMQSSDELKILVGTVFSELTKLDLELTRCAIWIFDKQGGTVWWMSNSEDPSNPMRFYLPYHEHEPYLVYLNAWKNKEPKVVYELKGDTKKAWDVFLLDESELSNLPVIVKEGMKAPERVFLSASFNKFGGLNVATLQPLSDEHFDILLRFARVFEMSYTRFHDLKQAESQAREAQIEVGLERVRARTMAMHNSDDVGLASATMFTELERLGIEHFRGGITHIRPDKTQEVWSVSTVDDGKIVKAIGVFNMMLHPFWRQVLEAWEKKEEFSYYFMSGEDKLNYIRILNSDPSYLPQAIRDLPDCSIQVYFFGEGGVWSFSTRPHSEAEKTIMKRFASVFSLTFRRYKDLQKAEGQARESQIQLALERVRARTMAMQKSDELADAAVVLFQQFAAIGETPDRISIGIVDEQSGTTDVWATDQAGTEINIHFKARNTEPTTIKKIVEAWRTGEKTTLVDLQGEDLQAWIHYLRNELGMVIDDSYFHGRRLHHVSFFSQGWLNITTLEPLPSEILDLLDRFAAVFNLTYTRFTDLKKAEGQAREAKIEASLERVRARAMAMHKTEDLNDAVATVFEQLASLDIGVLRCGIGILNRDKPSGDVWVTTSTGEGQLVQVAGDEAMDIHPLLQGAYDAWLKNSDFSYVLKGEDMTRYYEALGPTNFHLPQSQLILSAKEDGYVQHYFVTPFEHGTVFAFCEHAFPDHVRKVISRFASVFDMTYKRFLDIKKAEGNAREARIETSLERVRAKAMGMHSSQDLSETINLFYHELGVLGIVPRRCGVSLIDKETRIGEILSMNTTDSGQSMVVGGKLLLKGHEVLENAYNGWVNQQEYHTVLRGKEIGDYYKVVLPQVNFPEYPNDVVQYGDYFFFPEGAVFAWSTEQAKEEDLDIYRRFTSVLSLTYRRYKELIDAEEMANTRLEDFRKLEEAKNRTETALNELKATQSQLIQAEKMASLGELTAGIAHEIQNPLNFVNNFSEVNRELLDELNQELATGNWQSAKELAESLRDNEEKITHHGKRADAIVKSMLQHSRISAGNKELTNINELADEYLRLAYHGFRAKDKIFNAKFETKFDPGIPKINIVPQEMGRVLLNLINNAFYAVNEKKKQNLPGYEPVVCLKTDLLGNQIRVSVRDNGKGMSPEIKEKIFQPFFTTKPTGQGTGLGLSLSYDIVKAHGGGLTVETKEGEGSEFILNLPH